MRSILGREPARRKGVRLWTFLGSDPTAGKEQVLRAEGFIVSVVFSCGLSPALPPDNYKFRTDVWGPKEWFGARDSPRIVAGRSGATPLRPKLSRQNRRSHSRLRVAE